MKQRYFDVLRGSWLSRRLARKLTKGRYISESQMRVSVSKRTIALGLRGDPPALKEISEDYARKLGLCGDTEAAPDMVVEDIAPTIETPIPPPASAKRKRGRPRKEKAQ